MKLTGENRSTRGKPVPVPLCPPQIPHGFTRDRARASSATNRLSHGAARCMILFPEAFPTKCLYEDTDFIVYTTDLVHRSLILTVG
jgi:hypothetical protein